MALLERIAKGHEDFREEITTWQREFEVRQDLFKVQEGLDTIKRTKTGVGIEQQRPADWPGVAVQNRFLF